MGLFSKDKNQQIILDEKDFRKFVGALKEHGQLVKLIGPGFAAGSVTALWNKWSGGRPTFQFSTSDKSQWKDIFGGLLTYEMLMVRQGHDHISALQLRARYGDDVEFIHQEVYTDNDPAQGLREPLQRFNLPTEPWLFVVGADGAITARLEGSFGLDAIERALKTAL